MSSEAWKDTGDCADKRRMERIIKAHFIRSAVTGRIYPKLAHLAEEKQDG